MSYNTDLQNNNAELQDILNTINELPDANSNGTNDLLETVTINNTLLWDGNTDGKTVFDMTGDGTYTYYPVSDNVLSLADLENGVTIEMCDAEGTLLEEINVTDFVQVASKVLASASVSSILFVTGDNASFYGNTIPTKGIYFMHSSEYGYVSRIKIEGYTGFNTETQVLRKRYLPDHKHSWDEITDKPEVINGGAGTSVQQYITSRNTYIMPVPHGYCESKLTYTDYGAKVTDAFKSNEKLAAMMKNFSDLAKAHPDYVTETLLGKDASGTYNIYKYEMDFHPAIDSGNASVMRYDKPVFIITAGLHGIEPDAVFEVYHFMKDLCENYFESEHLEYLRTNVKLVVVPISNPWGFVNGTYNNSNNVNLNKNFEHGFSPVTGATNTQLNSGTAPYTEAEAVLLKGVFDEYSNAVFHLECHGKAVVDNAYNDVIWFSLMQSLSSEFIELCANTLVNQIGRRLYKLGYNKEKTEGGYITYYTLGGRPKDYTGTEYGMLSCTMEGTGRMGVAGHTTFGADEQRINCEALANFVLRVLDSLSSMAGDIVLVGDTSTVNNPKNYRVTNNLTNVSTSNAVTRIFAGDSYAATLTAVDGYELSTCNVTMNGSAVAVTNGVISIPSITGDIVVTASAVKKVVRYSVTKNLSNCTISNSATTAIEGEPYTATITANDGYDLSSVTVTMGGTPVTVSNGLINIANVTGNIVITATATERAPDVVTRSITTNLTNCTISNTATTVVDGSSYAATITPKTGYVLGNVTVTMGGSAVAVTNGVINISNVTGDIVITANAVVDTSNLLPSADTTTLISGDLTTATKYTGYFGGVRLNSSGLLKAQSGYAATGFIPYTYQGASDYIKIKEFTPAANGTYNQELCFYDSSHKFLGYAGHSITDPEAALTAKDNGTIGWYMTKDSDGTYVLKWKPAETNTVKNGTVDTSKIAYIRIGAGDFANATITISH